ncbi:MAG TPA: hypothetical protein VHY58_05415 [Streptosporangiaceae bacterium]|nr:hypothetical protein [Streptosporangiaceae bacterium]
MTAGRASAAPAERHGPEQNGATQVNRRGVCYDVGTVYSGFVYQVVTRPVYDPGITRRELEIIKTELHCNAVRIVGRDVGRLMRATEIALGLGLEVWLSPALYEKSPDQTLAYYLTVARAAEELRARLADAACDQGKAAAGPPAAQAGPDSGHPQRHEDADEESLCAQCPGSLCLRSLRRSRQQVSAQIVFCLGGELSLFMRGIVPGRSIPERVANMIGQAKAGDHSHTERLNAFLGKASEAIHGVFRGPLSYAALIGESVDWTRFDFIGLDHYRDARIKDRYADMLAPFLATGQPVVVTETGMRGYRGAQTSGTLGFGVVDQRSQFLHQLPLLGRLVKARLNGEYVRDEGLQARELAEVLAILDGAGVDGVFVNSFVEPLAPFSEDPRHDLDMSALSLVKSYTDRRGSTFPDMPWEPKEAFGAVAGRYAGQPAST